MKSFPLLFLFLLLSVASCSKKTNTDIKPIRTDITESVYASGTVKAVGQYTVFATVNGVLKQTSVTVGQQIKKGQLLFLLDQDKAALNTENAQLAYKLSQENNRYIQDKIAEMETKVQMAKDKLGIDIFVCI